MIDISELERRLSEATGRKRRKCSTCDGTGQWVLFKSWFPADGFRRTHCHICGGSGFYPDHVPAAAAAQRRMRALSGEIDHE